MLPTYWATFLDNFGLAKQNVMAYYRKHLTSQTARGSVAIHDRYTENLGLPIWRMIMVTFPFHFGCQCRLKLVSERSRSVVALL